MTCIQRNNNIVDNKLLADAIKVFYLQLIASHRFVVVVVVVQHCFPKRGGGVGVKGRLEFFKKIIQILSRAP